MPGEVEEGESDDLLLVIEAVLLGASVVEGDAPLVKSPSRFRKSESLGSGEASGAGLILEPLSPSCLVSSWLKLWATASCKAKASRKRAHRRGVLGSMIAVVCRVEVGRSSSGLLEEGQGSVSERLHDGGPGAPKHGRQAGSRGEPREGRG